MTTFDNFAMASESAVCIFHQKSAKLCGVSSSSGRTEYVPLTKISCNEDMANHLLSCHLAQSYTEYEILLARAGIFSLKAGTMERMIICPVHRDQYGKYWRPPSTCQHPHHEGKDKKALKKSRHLRVINMTMSTIS